mmetsp:Transcript_175027/g.561262  ORF Transcript_175027/g.561262 Transcript_175027/m.561262 type:complete len:305 (+) Transcript_175027:531-1445(+)
MPRNDRDRIAQAGGPLEERLQGAGGDRGEALKEGLQRRKENLVVRSQSMLDERRNVGAEGAGAWLALGRPPPYLHFQTGSDQRLVPPIVDGLEPTRVHAHHEGYPDDRRPTQLDKTQGTSDALGDFGLGPPPQLIGLQPEVHDARQIHGTEVEALAKHRHGVEVRSDVRLHREVQRVLVYHELHRERQWCPMHTGVEAENGILLASRGMLHQACEFKIVPLRFAATIVHLQHDLPQSTKTLATDAKDPATATGGAQPDLDLVLGAPETADRLRKRQLLDAQRHAARPDDGGVILCQLLDGFARS